MRSASGLFHRTTRNIPFAVSSMTENQSSNPVDPNGESNQSPESSRVPDTRKRTKRGHFGSGGFAPHRETSAPRQHFETPAAPPQGTPATEPSAAPPATPKRSFGAAEGNKPDTPQQLSPPVRSTSPMAPFRLPVDSAFEWTRLIFLTAILAPLCIWGSWNSWESMVYEWCHSADYGHGLLVIPATILFLFLRRDSYPGTSYKLDWVGLFPIFLYGVLRLFAGIYYMDALDAIAIFFWILSIVWFFYGWRVFLWALPSLCFLVFMFQLPWRFDVIMRNQLQYFAAHFASVLLQLVGEAAVPIKNTIRLSTTELGVEAACSGLRFLMSVFAIAFATVLLMRRPWWQNILIMAIAAPLALFVNAVRIAITGILLEHFNEMVSNWTKEGQTVGVAADLFAGKIAIILALGLFALFVWYLGKVFRRVEI